MKRVLTAVVLIPLVLLVVFKAPDWLYSGILGLVAILAIHEYFGIALHYQEGLFWYLMEVAVGLYFLGHCLHGVEAFGVMKFGNKFESLIFDLTSYRVLPLFLLVLGLLTRQVREVLPTAALSYFGFLYIAVTLGELSLIGHYENGRVLVFIFLVLIWLGDTFAYYVGRSLGRHKLAPVISPGKTWEGAIASAVGATLISIFALHYLHQLGNLLVRLDVLPSQSIMYADARIYDVPWWLAALFGLCLNISAQFGDLVESALKRGAGVKDSGTLLPGHGGMLDRIDAMLLAAPVFWFFFIPLYRATIIKP